MCRLVWYLKWPTPKQTSKPTSASSSRVPQTANWQLASGIFFASQLHSAAMFAYFQQLENT